METLTKKNYKDFLNSIEILTEKSGVKSMFRNPDFIGEVRKEFLKSSFSVPTIGRIVFFNYKAVYPGTIIDGIAFYDQFPLSLIINSYSDGFLGLNLHYLNFSQRKEFILQFFNRFKQPILDNAPVPINWQKALSHFASGIVGFFSRTKRKKSKTMARMMVHQYKFNRIKSKIVPIPYNYFPEVCTFKVDSFKNMGDAAEILRRI